jgi:hypothetical protein
VVVNVREGRCAVRWKIEAVIVSFWSAVAERSDDTALEGRGAPRWEQKAVILSRNNAVVVAKFAVIAFGGVRVLGQLHCSWEKG